MTYVKIVVIEPEWVQPMTVTTDNNDPGVLCSYDLLHDQVGEQERPQMVCCQVGLKSVRGELVIHRHDSCIVDKDINNRNVVPRVDLRGCLAHAFQGAQVHLERADLDRRLGLGDFCSRLGQLVGIASGQDEPGRLGLGNGLDEKATQGAGRDSGSQNDLSFYKGGVIGNEFISGGMGIVGGRHGGASADGDSRYDNDD